MHPEKDKIERGSGNVFADLGRPDAEAHLLKAQLVTRIEMRSSASASSSRSTQRRFWDSRSLTYRVSCAEISVSTQWNGFCVC